MSSPLPEDYFRWLIPQIRDKHHKPEKSYVELCHLMHQKEFVPFIPNDDNREADGRDLRSEFCYTRNMPTDTYKTVAPASFLEVLVALSRRLSFAAGGQAHGWAWQLLENLGLTKMTDKLSVRKAKQVDDILDACIWRTYGPDGQGGFFPLAWPDEDQRKVELWYQMAAYIHELHPEH